MQFSTRPLPPAQRTDRYETVLRDYFSVLDCAADVAVVEAQPEVFAASLEHVMLGQLSGAFHCCNSPHSVHSRPAGVFDPGMDFYYVRSGSIVFHGDDGTSELRAGDMMLMRSDREFVSYSERMEIVALAVPQRLACDPALARRWRTDCRIPGDVGLGACLAALLGAAVPRHHELGPREGAVLQAAVLNWLILLGLREEDPGVLSERQSQKLDQLKSLGLQSLQDAALTPAALAHRGGVSVRTLHRLFNGSGVTFRGWLREARLQRCWEELTESRRPQVTIASIAYRWGFNDLQTFNRSFNARYGMTPQAARRHNTR